MIDDDVYPGERVTSDSRRITINPSGTTLTIGLVYASDAGTYQCVAESDGGRRTAAAQLRVITQGALQASAPISNLFSAARYYTRNIQRQWVRNDADVLCS